MEASVLPVDLGARRASAPPVLLRLRTDEQLVALFRAGNEEAFGVIHDRFQTRLLAYVRRMLPPGPRANAEDVLQDVFLRAYSALRADDRPVALRAWLYRVAHNRCVDELRRPGPQPAELAEQEGDPRLDPALAAERRERLRRLVTDLGRLPEQQRSALLMRELEGFTYVELGQALGVSQPAVKSLLVRARMGLAEAAQARETGCDEIREDLAGSRDRKVRTSARARRHLRDCGECRSFDTALRTTSRDLAALLPGPGLFAMLAGLLGGGVTAGGGATAGGGVGAGIAGGGVAAATATKVAVAVCCVAVTAGGAATVEHTLRAPPAPAAHAAAASPAADGGGAPPAPAAPAVPAAPADPAVAVDPAAIAPDATAAQPADAAPAEPAPDEDTDPGTGGTPSPVDEPATDDPSGAADPADAAPAPAAPPSTTAVHPAPVTVTVVQPTATAGDPVVATSATTAP